MTEQEFLQESAQIIEQAVTNANKIAALLKDQPPVQTLGGLVSYDILTMLLQTGNTVVDVLSLSKRTIVAKQDASKILHEATEFLKDAQRRLHAIANRP